MNVGQRGTCTDCLQTRVLMDGFKCECCLRGRPSTPMDNWMRLVSALLLISVWILIGLYLAALAWQMWQ